MELNRNNDVLHHQVLNLSKNLISQLSNYMEDQGMAENSQVN